VSDKTNSAKALVEAGIVHLEEENPQDALDLFRQALILDENNADALCGKGLCLLHFNDSMTGWANLHQAANLGSEAAQYYLRRQSMVNNKSWLRYAIAVSTCIVVAVIWNIIGVSVLNWKHAGGIVGLLFPLPLLYVVWDGIITFKSGTEKNETNTLCGVHGWLGLFCILTITDSIFGLLIFRSTSKFLQTYVDIGKLLFEIWGLSTAIFLIIKTKYCITNAKIFLTTSIAVYLIPLSLLPSNMATVSAIRFMLSIAWLTYFISSKRVKTTYAHALSR
jgi:tetratricopeptide (TPR) repeat protein